jgi:hypothetical protein
VDESSYRAELEALPTKEVYLRARRRAVRRLDVRFFWTLLRSIPAAEAAAGEVEEAQADVGSGIARLNDLRDAGEGKLGAKVLPCWASSTGLAQRDQLVDGFVDALGEQVGVGERFGVRIDPEE